MIQQRVQLRCEASSRLTGSGPDKGSGRTARPIAARRGGSGGPGQEGAGPLGPAQLRLHQPEALRLPRRRRRRRRRPTPPTYFRLVCSRT